MGKGEAASFISDEVSSTTPRAVPNRLKLSRQPSRRRLLAMLVVIVLMFSLVIGRLAQLQVVSSDRYRSYGEALRIHSIPLAADRGTIFDRNGRDLALSVPQQTIWADPRELKDDAAVAEVASRLAPILDKDYTELRDDIQSYKIGQKGFMYLARKVDDETARVIDDLNLPGVHAYEEPKRFLPGDNKLGSLIGTVDIDNKGQGGIEGQYNKQLSGRAGNMVVEQDISGRDIPGGLRRETAPVRGDDLMLTIDSDLQYKVETALEHEINIAKARGGMAAVMDTETGEVLALANLAVANDGYGTPVEAARNNMVLENVYEPGSVSKLITISAALEEKIVNPTTDFTVPDEMRVADAVFGDAEEHAIEHWNTTDIVAASSNIGTIMIAQQLGKERLDRFQRSFGYGSKTGLGVLGESAGLILDPKKYSGTSLATTAIGQGVSVTAMQMLAAFNTIANEGTYVAPKLVRATIDSKGKAHPTAASATRQVVSPQTAAQMNLMLQEVVRAGTATTAQISGYEVAGKTGTARKPRTDGPGYQTGKYISSFAGFVPAARPKFTAIVILDEPTPIFGGLVAAPVFADIARYALQSSGVAPVAWGPDRHGVPLVDESASSAAGTNDAKPGTSAADAEAATKAAASGVGATSSTSSSTTSTTQRRPGD